MDPEQRLTVVVEDFAVKILVIVVAALVGMPGPERMGIAQGNRTFVDLYLILFRRDFYLFFGAVLFFLLLIFRVFVDMLYHNVVIAKIFFIDGLIFLRCVCLGEENFHRHEGTVFFNDFSYTVFVGEFQAVFIQIQGDLGSDNSSVAVLHRIFGASVAFPVYRSSTLFIGKRVDVDIICNHECRIEAKTEMTDHLICVGFILILLKKFRCAGKGDLSNVLLHLVGGHTDTVIDKFQGFVFRVHNDLNPGLIVLRKFIFTHSIQLFQLGDCIAAVGDKLADKDVVVGIHPFLYYRENIITVD